MSKQIRNWPVITFYVAAMVAAYAWLLYIASPHSL
jgi:hypothetical protein